MPMNQTERILQMRKAAQAAVTMREVPAMYGWNINLLSFQILKILL